MTPATWLLGLAAGLLLTGLAGVISALSGHIPEWNDIYFYGPLWITGTASGWLFGAGLEFSLWRQRESTDIRMNQARAYALEVETERRALVMQAPTTPTLTPDAIPVNPYPDRWATYWRRLAQAGDAYGWTQATLTTENTLTKVMSETAWNVTIPMLVEAGWLSGGKPGRATRWASGRSLKAFEEAEAWKALPHPDSDPPVIELPPYRNNTTPRGNTRNTTLPVIEG